MSGVIASLRRLGLAVLSACLIVVAFASAATATGSARTLGSESTGYGGVQVGEILGAVGATPTLSGWGMYGYDANGAYFNPNETALTPSTVSGLRQAWTADQGVNDTQPGTMVVGNGIVVVQEKDGTVRAFNELTGTAVWTAPVNASGERTPAIAGGIVYASTQVPRGINGGGVVALNAATGAVIWTHTLPSGAPTNPVVSGNLVYVAQGVALFGLNTSDGSQAFEVVPPNAPYDSAAAPTIAGGILVDHWDTMIAGFNATTGAFLWSYSVRAGYPMGQVESAGGLVYGLFTLIDGKTPLIVALHATDGTLAWSTSPPTTHAGAGMATGNGLVWLEAQTQLIGLSATTGAVVVQTADMTPSNPNDSFTFGQWSGPGWTSSPTLAGGVIYAPYVGTVFSTSTRTQGIAMFSATTGASLGSALTFQGNYLTYSPVAVTDGRLFTTGVYARGVSGPVGSTLYVASL